jgi:hypothetical protein
MSSFGQPHVSMLQRTVFDSPLLELNTSKVSAHHAKAGFDYPMIRLPYRISKLAGLSTRIHQTVHGGALAFLIVVSPTGKVAKKGAKKLQTQLKTLNRPP